MKKQITFLTLFIMICFSSLHAQVTQEWVSRYNGIGNGSDNAFSIAVDGSGNVYITGSSPGAGPGSDFATIKYNSSGIQQWAENYNGSGNDYDEANSLAIDGSGNVYVTGYCTDIGTGYDYTTIKYNSSGDSLWVARYNGPGNGSDYAYSIAVDGSGNVYVTGGSSNGGPTNREFATIKYNSSGIQQWVERYSRGFGDDYARSIAVDGSGNVYVTGVSNGNGTYEYQTIKYNSSGVQQWVTLYKGTGNYLDYVTSLAIDVSGNVYVTGQSTGSNADYDYATIKYNSSGIQQWAAIYNSGIGHDFARSIAVDALGNVYVTGGSAGSGTGFDYATVKYNVSGDQQWSQRYNGPGNGEDVALSLKLDASGNVYITGYSLRSGANSDYATIKYNSSGDQQWIQRYNGPANQDNAAFSIALDNSENVYVTGGSLGNGTGYDYATIKYSQPTGIQNISSEIPNDYSLSQNYPNPFNPITVIRYSLIENRFVKLNVYDVLGNEVATLVNEKQNAGSYSVDFDGSNLSSGIYFYKLQTGNFSEVKKMTLLK